MNGLSSCERKKETAYIHQQKGPWTLASTNNLAAGDEETKVLTVETYQGAKNSTIQRSLLLSTFSSKFREFNSTDALGSELSEDPPVAFPCTRSFSSVLICMQSS